ncbi:hypothetical protein BV22DRAFT_1051635 [Leucogyrophana mollusca]|uniref:Uncharacterized protein n=1 Tax=Leucogyrophana mollusca TaxID=85980 RepID=A0ACB8B1K7_9AGAM|nr:hypothetical protein BV22DRAFT_1051635 [Leucogyrophana mollusca]
MPMHASGDDFIVINGHGIHEVGLDYCKCKTAEQKTTQLMHMSWFPSTMVDLKTAVTFHLLEEFHLLSFKSKALNLWSGCSYEPGGVQGAKEGKLAVLCPTCSHPNKNLPNSWENVFPAKRWIYGLFVTIKANFRLKRKVVSKDLVDTGLSRGWTYFVDEVPYKLHLRDRINELQEGSRLTNQYKSTRSSHSAVDMADIKSSRGLTATGVGTVDCAYHNMKLPGGVRDL